MTVFGTPLQPQTTSNHFKKLAAEIGAPNAKVHDLRHTYAVLSLQNGDDVKTVQGNLGHATAAFTLDVYGHVSDAMKTASANRMEEYVRQNPGNMMTPMPKNPVFIPFFRAIFIAVRVR